MSNIWEGVYASIDDVPRSGDEHDSLEWVNALKNSTIILYGELLLSKKKYYDFIKLGTIIKIKALKNSLRKQSCQYSNQDLYETIENLYEKNNRKVDIMDIGGGMGIHYILANIQKQMDQKIGKYIIAETKTVSEEGKKFWKRKPSYKNVYFISDFINNEQVLKVDLIYSKCTLQYLEGYKKALAKICEYNPEIIIFERIPLGDHPTFFSCQVNIQNNQIPCEMINRKDLVELLDNYGYDVKYECKREYDRYIDNLPKEWRPNSFTDMAFAKRK